MREGDRAKPNRSAVRGGVQFLYIRILTSVLTFRIYGNEVEEISSGLPLGRSGKKDEQDEQRHNVAELAKLSHWINNL